MTLHWIEEAFMLTQEDFDRLTRIVRPGEHLCFLSTPRHEGHLFGKFTKGANMPDNWKHRSEGMKCKTCMWFVPKVPNYLQNDCIIAEKTCLGHPGRPVTAGEILKQPYDLGRCRRHAPTMNGWPVVFVNDWCGDHKLDEEKI
jgi:hypothetical protein